ncbi:MULTISPECIES: NAD(P)-dependent oxidoreductase [unclassified Saccharopolyspora]|uniref:NAD-dependent epimerase/dehydratase family protein n=1 Tax=unclassified Saccharopolyspora TaxID=2646250 RepID=UPI001CD6A7B6|nr:MULTISPECIES: NAD(P)-dependent oxidoreductase [unclassified Saccharopolyspora]MCA1190376.1 NAD(P)-dependent oxidoreductase [Saccharopolyspora sp. 6T]MCA1194572.1 NAD(P)-dependent oxidoreductase [Saccharopolyspora sp. 6V]
MEVVGSGFLARHCTAWLGAAHPEVVLIAAGVSTTSAADTAEFDREAALVGEVLRRCRADGRTAVFLSTSSAAIYGSDGTPGREDGPVFPLNAYGRHKLALERVCELSGARFLVLRLTHLVGDGQQPAQLLPSLVRGVLDGVVTVHPEAHRDLLDVRHVPPVLDALCAAGVRDEVVNVASGVPIPVPTVVAALRRRLDADPEVRALSRPPELTRVDLAKLHRLVPAFAEHDFGPGYLDDLLDRYLHSYLPTSTVDLHSD